MYYSIIHVFSKYIIIILDFERKDKCVDFTMMCISFFTSLVEKNALIFKNEGGSW